VYLGVSHAPIPRERDSSVPQFLGPHMRAYSKETTKLFTVSKLYVRIILQGRPRMLTRELFAVAKLLVSFFLNF